jgi:hypothetical protein
VIPSVVGPGTRWAARRAPGLGLRGPFVFFAPRLIFVETIGDVLGHSWIYRFSDRGAILLFDLLPLGVVWRFRLKAASACSRICHRVPIPAPFGWRAEVLASSAEPCDPARSAIV